MARFAYRGGEIKGGIKRVHLENPGCVWHGERLNPQLYADIVNDEATPDVVEYWFQRALLAETALQSQKKCPT